MPKVQVLVTLTAEAVVEVPPDVGDVEAYVRERVALDWAGLGTTRVVQEPTITVAHFLLAEPVEAPAEVDAIPAPEPLEVAEPEPEPVAVEEPAVDFVAESVEESVAETVPAEAIAATPPYSLASEAVEPEVAEPVEAPPVAAYSAAAYGGPSRELTREEVLQLFTDPLYKDMIRSAVRDRAEALLEGVVSEVVAELMPLLRRHIERHK